MGTNDSAHLARRVLIGRIETLAIGRTDAALSFEGRLAAEKGWSEDFAARVTEANDTVPLSVPNLADGSVARTEPVALTAEDIAGAELPGQFACGFADRGGNILICASGNVQSAENAVGLVKIADELEPLTVPGGFKALVRGPTLAGSGLMAPVSWLRRLVATMSRAAPTPRRPPSTKSSGSFASPERGKNR